MKMRIFGKEAEIKTGAAVAAVAVLALLGMLVGYLFLRDNGEIIIEAGKDAQGTPDIAAVINPDMAGAGSISGNDSIYTGYSAAEGDASEGSANDAGQKGGTGSGGDSGAGIGTGNSAESETDKSKIKVYVVGCVKKPGIVTINRGRLICDAVEEAGGLTENADADNINMVFSLNENVMLYIKSKEEGKGVGNGAAIYSGSGPAAEVLGDNNTAGSAGIKTVLVNINTAGIDELDTLPGIGEATAKDIIAFREKHGDFKAIEDIMKVPRIKQNRFESIRDFISVE